MRTFNYNLYRFSHLGFLISIVTGYVSVVESCVVGKVIGKEVYGKGQFVRTPGRCFHLEVLPSLLLLPLGSETQVTKLLTRDKISPLEILRRGSNYKIAVLVVHPQYAIM